MLYAVLGGVDNAADCFVPTTRPAICTDMHRLRSTRRLSTPTDSCCRRRDEAGGAACAWTDVWCMLCRSVNTDCLVEHSSRQRQTTGDLSAVDRALDSSVSQAVREELPQTAHLGQPSPAPTCLWARAMAKMVQMVQRSVAATVSAALAPSVHALTRGFWASCLSPSRDSVGACSMGSP